MDVTLVYGNKAGNCFSVRFDICGFQTPSCEVPLSYLFYLRVQRSGHNMAVHEKVKPFHRAFRVGKMHLTEAREQGLFFIGSMLGRSFSKVAQRRFQCRASFFGQRRINDRRYSIESSEEHLNATVAVRQKAGGIGKAVRPGSKFV